jgi:uncharacterized membrane protein YozB (DUF420 family)
VERGLLGTAAPLSSDAILIIELGMGLALLAGARLARRKRYRAHAWCQSVVVLLNLAAILLTMVPSFRQSFATLTPAGLTKSYYLLAAVHATLGTVAELLALYILLVAGTNILPGRLRFTRYRTWMRAALVFWWAALLLGLATYVRWYLVPALSHHGFLTSSLSI